MSRITSAPKGKILYVLLNNDGWYWLSTLSDNSIDSWNYAEGYDTRANLEKKYKLVQVRLEEIE